MALEGVRVYIPANSHSASNDGEAAVIANLATALGASVLYSWADNANAIVTDNFKGDWYLPVAKSKRSIPCFKRSWLEACARSGEQVLTHTHKLGGLEGLKISVTGLTDVQLRGQFKEEVQKGGAEFSADLVRDCTHLVAYSSSGAKFKYAISWGMHVVSPEWLEASRKLGFRQDETPYSLKPAPQTQDQANKQQVPPQRQPQEQQQPLQQPASNAEKAHQAAPTTKQTKDTASRDQSSVNPKLLPLAPATGPVAQSNTAENDAAQQAQAKAASTSNTTASTVVGVIKPQSTTSASSVSVSKVPAPSTQTNKPHSVNNKSEDEGLYMSWVRFHVIGASPSDALQIRQLVAQCGAIRELVLNSRVTHIIAGTAAQSGDLAAIREHVMAWRDHVRIVKLQWLKHCVDQEQCQEPPDASFVIPITSLPGKTSSLLPGTNSGLLPAQATALVGITTASVDFCDLGTTDTRSRFPDVAATAAGSTGAGTVLSKVDREALKGYWFTLVAAPHDRELGQLVRDNGGSVFTADSARLATKDMSKVFALCPASMPALVMQELERTAPDLRLVPIPHRVTGYWLKECLKTSKLLDVSDPNIPAFRPLPFDVPLQPFPSSRLHVAGFSPASAVLKRGIMHLASILGATVTNELSPHNTHLILPQAQGQKYEMSTRLGMVTANEQWILHIGRTGRVPDAFDQRYRPAGETAEQRQFARTQHVNKSHVMVSQLQNLTIGPTQTASSTQQQAASTVPARQPPSNTSKSLSYTPSAGFRLTEQEAQRASNGVMSVQGTALSSSAHEVAGTSQAIGNAVVSLSAQQSMENTAKDTSAQQTHQETQPGQPGGPVQPKVAVVGQPAALPALGTSTEEDFLDLQTSIQALIQTHGRASSTDLATGNTATAAGPPDSSNLLASLAGGNDASRSSGGSAACLASLGQDVCSRQRPVTRRVTAKRQAHHKDANTRKQARGREDSDGFRLEEMSQQVGYDESQRPDERLLRKQDSAGENHDIHGSADKQHFLNRMLRQAT